MAARVPPQPSPDRLTDFAGHPLVVGVTPGQPDLVALTAASMGRATGAPAIYFAYVDEARYPVREHPDGTVDHAQLDPDGIDDAWMQTQADLVEKLARVLTGPEPAWEFRYLAGRVDRALTHLARAVDAAGFVVGTHLGRHRRIAGFLNESVAVQLSHRQHRPVLLVPLQVVDWQGRAPWE